MLLMLNALGDDVKPATAQGLKPAMASSVAPTRNVSTGLSLKTALGLGTSGVLSRDRGRQGHSDRTMNRSGKLPFFLVFHHPWLPRRQ